MDPGRDREASSSERMAEMGLDSQAIQRRLEAVRFTDDDRARVRSLAPILDAFATRGADLFVRYLLDAGALGHAASDPLVRQISELKRAHIRAMAVGEYGDRYVCERIALARLYGEAGLEVSWFLGGFRHLITAIGREILALRSDGAAEAFASYLSLEKVAFFDIALMVDTLIFERERTIGLQKEAIRGLSTPVLRVRPGLLVLPLIGLVDEERSSQLTAQLLREIQANRARAAVVDVTGVVGLDAGVANHLLLTIEAARVMGAVIILSGISPEIAETVVSLGIDLGGVRTAGDLELGVAAAEALLAPYRE
jgi:rsbT co-antagonist protein RsbR